MRTFGRTNTTKQWARLALKMGLLLTDAKLWENLNEQIRDRAGDFGDTVKEKYGDASDRLSDRYEDVRSAIRGETDWATPLASFVGGVALGVGIGMLFAPVSGEEARSVLRDKAYDVKDRVNDIAGGGSKFRPGSATGTDGD